MKRIIYFIFLLLMISCGSNNRQHVTTNYLPPMKDILIEEEYLNDGFYINENIGWQIQAVENSKITSKKELDSQVSLGASASGMNTGSINDLDIYYLLSYTIDEQNSFQSLLIPNRTLSMEEYLEEVKASNQVIYNGYANYGINVTMYLLDQSIDNVDFIQTHVSLSDEDGVIFFEQDLFRTQLNGFDFGINLSYNNEMDKNSMFDKLLKSKFTNKPSV